MPAICADPPSVVGTGGGQIEPEEWLAIVAVEVAASVELAGLSPGNCTGTWDVFAGDALMPVAPASPADPVVASDLLPADADPPVDPVGNVEVGTLSGSEPELRAVKASSVVVVWLRAAVWPMPPAWPGARGAAWLLVWAFAAVTPRSMIAINRTCRIVLSSSLSARAQGYARGDNARNRRKWR